MYSFSSLVVLSEAISFLLLLLVIRGFIADAFAANGYGEHSPNHYSLLACGIAEATLTALLVFRVVEHNQFWFRQTALVASPLELPL